MNFVLLRFALIAVGVLLLVIVGGVVLMALKRRGAVSQETLDKARRQAMPIARAVMENRGRGGGRGGLLNGVMSALNDRDRRR
ncbi:hypothetical protein B1H19_30765 [Streptomyces gilvosporeus]|uniref:Uncharacterized protein n=2 Tax=Streptomyces gilvosporeus TaxID=553510 RepID=A0A1V0TYK1_9ACTN|nr:hypothetical protein B1H19_30765 [Streptomyces gilvosporeus]